MMVLSLGSGTMGANHSTSLMGTKPNAPSASEAALKAWEGQLVVARLIVFYLLQIFNIYKLRSHSPAASLMENNNNTSPNHKI